MKSLSLSLVAIVLLAFAGLAVAAEHPYHADPLGAGRHWEPKPDGVCYENSRVVLNCDGLTVTKQRKLFRTIHRWEFRADQAYVKLEPGESLAPGEAMRIVQAQFTEPFYDRSERRMVRIKAIAVGADLVTTAVGLHVGNCSEAGPFKHVPGLGLVIGVGDVVYTRRIAKDSPRFFTTSKEKLAWTPAVTHGAAAVHNLVRCVF